MKKIIKQCAYGPLIMMLAITLSACGGGGSGTAAPDQDTDTDNNLAPIVSAGNNITVNLPNTSTLTAVVSDDDLPQDSSLTLSWSKSSGSGVVSFTNSDAAQSQVSFSQAGSYQLTLTVSDGEKSSSDTLNVTVNPALSVEGYVLKANHALPVERTLPSDPLAQIQFTVPDALTGLTQLSATAQTFEANATLYVINLSTQRKYQFSAEADGSITGAEIFAPYGSELLIRVNHAITNAHLADLSATLSNYLKNSYQFEFLELNDDESMRSASGFRINVMPASINSGEFYKVGLARQDEFSYPMALHGTMSETSALNSTSTPNMNLDVRVFATGTLETPQAILALKPSHDAQGQPLGVLSQFITTHSDVLGNPVSRQVEKRVSTLSVLEPTATNPDSQGINLSFNGAVDFALYKNEFNNHGLIDGHYLLEFNLAHNHTGSSDLTMGGSVTGDNTLVSESGNPLLLPLEIGASLDESQEPLVFFMDTTSDGYQGVYDQVTFPNFGLNLISHMAQETPVLQRYRSDGSLKEYDFSPFFPRLSAADRNSPSALYLDLDAKNSSLQITLTTPDGQDIVLPVVNGQYLRHHHDKNLNLNSRSNGGVHMTDILQMSLKDDTGAYTLSFTKSGDYQLKVLGTLKTLSGKTLSIDQSMGFTVADYLVTPLYATLPMMPLQAGESITPMVTLLPAIPAEVTVAITYAMGDQTSTTTTFSGTANHSGVFVADAAMAFTQAGVYKVTISTKHTSEAGHIYAGSRVFASVVAQANPSMSTHGKRGIDNFFDQGVPANRWFSRDALNASKDYVVGSGHVLAPYEAGDIEWVEEDAAAVVRASLAYDASLAATQAQCNEGSFDTWSATGELSITDCVPSAFARPLSNVLPTQGFSAISYNAAERFSVRVRESIGDEQAHGYWRFNDSYGNQRGVGTIGDKFSEVKFQYIGTQVNDYENSQSHFLSYASLLVLSKDDDAPQNDTRVFPPFNGHGSQPGGGAILSLGDRDVDGFIWPTTLIPGSVLNKGQALPFYGQMAPTLPMHLDLTITAPDGTELLHKSQANKNGFVQTNNLTFDQAGVYRIQPTLTYKLGQFTSAGMLMDPLTSDIVIDQALLALENDYFIFVKDSDNSQSIPMNIQLDTNPASPSTLDLASAPTFRVLKNNTTKDLSNTKLYTSVFMDGWILDQDIQSASEPQALAYTLNLATLAQTFNTIDLGEQTGRENTYTDLIRISFLLEGTDSDGVKQVFTRTFTLDGENVLSN